ncbi:MAG: hypothetical protein AAF634_01285 [Bacteroidota bacterium]
MKKWVPIPFEKMILYTARSVSHYLVDNCLHLATTIAYGLVLLKYWGLGWTCLNNVVKRVSPFLVPYLYALKF